VKGGFVLSGIFTPGAGQKQLICVQLKEEEEKANFLFRPLVAFREKM
jgi:hypothetical protein